MPAFACQHCGTCCRWPGSVLLDAADVAAAARLLGLAEAEGMDSLRLEFAGGATRLVPAEELDRIWRYGSEAQGVALDRPGGEAWAKRRAEAEAALAARGRLVLRPSGTEPVVRVTVEADDADLMRQVLDRLADVVRAAA